MQNILFSFMLVLLWAFPLFAVEGASLQQASAEASTVNFGRGRPFDIQHIRLELEVDVEGERLSGVAHHRLTPVGRAAEVVEFDSVGLSIERVMLNEGASIDFEATEDRLKMYLPAAVAPGEEIRLAIHYHVRRPARGMHFRTERLGYEPEEVQAWTQGEPEDARYWFPCFDAPHERTMTEVVATVAERFEVISNGDLIESTPVDGGMKRVHYRLDEPHVTYLVSLVVGQFTVVEDEGGGVPLYYYVRPSLAAQVPTTFGNTPRMMSLFQDLLQSPYPYSRYSQVAVVDFMAGGMENTTASTLMERTVHDAAAHLTYSSDWLIAHELIHQWFGNLLTSRDWSHIWLNEAFASFFELVVAEDQAGEAGYYHDLLRFQDDVKASDTGDNRAPMVRRNFDNPMDMFDVRAYDKGACVLHMLRAQLGDALFYRCVRAYLERYRNKAVETNDLLRTFEEVSGVGLEQFFEQWVYSGGQPSLKVVYAWQPENSLLSLTVGQTQVVDEVTPLFHLPVDVAIHIGDAVQVERLIIAEKKQEFFVKVSERPSFIRFDPRGDLLKKLDFRQPKAMLMAQLKGDTTLAGQYEAIDALAEHAEEDVVAALTERLEQAEYWGVRARAVKTLAKMDLAVAEAALLQAAKQSEARVRLVVAEELGALDSEETRGALKALINDKSPYVAAAAIRSLATIAPELPASTFSEALARDSHAEVVRRAALEALARLEDESRVAVILPFLEAGRREVRRAAASALGEAGRYLVDKTVPRGALEARLEDPNPQVRGAVLDALQVLGDPAAIRAVESFGRTSRDEGERERAKDTANQLRTQRKAAEDRRELWREVDGLRDREKKLQEQVERMEKQVEALKPAS